MTTKYLVKNTCTKSTFYINIFNKDTILLIDLYCKTYELWFKDRGIKIKAYEKYY